MNAPDAEPPVELSEPFPWMSTNKPSGPYRMTLRTPLSEAVLGLFLIGVAVMFALTLFSRDSVEAVATGILLTTLTGGLGCVALVIAVARERWARAYRRIHGHRPV